MKKGLFVLIGCVAAFPSIAGAEELVSHKAVYDIALASTKGGAAGVVNAHGKMSYSIQKVCDEWRTESVFSLDVGYEMAGLDTTNWRQTTRESRDGCSFEFDVFVRDKGSDRKDLSGKAVCKDNRKVLTLSLPVRSEAVFPSNVVFPVRQTARLLEAAQKGEKSVSSYVYDGTRPESLYSMNAVVSVPDAKRPEKIYGDADLIAGKKLYRFDTAFFEEFPSGRPKDGTPRYEASVRYYENGVGDVIEQDFGAYKLRSTLTELKKLQDVPCRSKKKRQALTTR